MSIKRIKCGKERRVYSRQPWTHSLMLRSYTLSWFILLADCFATIQMNVELYRAFPRGQLESGGEMKGIDGPILDIDMHLLQIARRTIRTVYVCNITAHKQTIVRGGEFVLIEVPSVPAIVYRLSTK